MDDDRVSGFSSDKERGGGIKPPSRQLTWVEYAEEQCPYYMVMGVSPEQYWNGDYSLLKYYRKAFEAKRELDNENAWIQGMYVFEAVESAIAHTMLGKRKIKYPEEPYLLNTEISERRKEAKREEDELKSRDYMMTFMQEFNKRFENPEGVKKDG